MPLLHKIKKIFGGRIVTDGWDPKYLEELKSKKFVKKGDDIYEKDGRWFCTVASWNSSPAKAAGAELETEDGILQDFMNFLMEPTEKAASGDSAVVFSSEEAQEIAAKAGVDLTKYDLGEFCRGLEVELEHSDLTAGDPSMTAKIVVAHLNEIPDYYTRLGKMESDAKDTKDAMRMTNDPKERGKQKELFRALYPDYDPKRHDAFVVRYNQEEDKKNTLEYMKNRGIKDSLSDFDRKQKERGKIYKIILPAGMGEPLYTGSFQAALEMAKEYGKGTRVENLSETTDALSDFDRKQKERGKIYKIILPAGMGEPLYTSSAQAAIEMAKEYGKGTRVENLSETTDGGMDYDQYQRMKKEQLDDLKYAQEKGDKELEKRARATLAMIEQDWKESKDSAFKRFKDKLAVWKTKDSKQVGTYKGFNLYHVDTYSDGEKLYQGVDGDKIVRGKSLEEIKEKIDQSSRMNDKKACVRDAVRRLRYKGTTDGGVGSGIKGHVTAKQIAAMKARK